MTEMLAAHTTIRVGGPARNYVAATSEDELVDVIRDCDARGEPVLLLGGGSNLVVADAGFAGTVVAIRTRGVRVETDTCAGAWVEVAAGEPWDDIVARAATDGWVGVEFLSGIPGLVGATPVQNVGAYGQEVAATVAQVRVYDRAAGRTRTLAAADCGFGYRTSAFKARRFAGGPQLVVLSVTYQLRLGTLSEPVAYGDIARAAGVGLGTRLPLGVAREHVLGVRRGKGMILDAADHDTWSAGSFFTNPVLTERAYDELAARCSAGGADAPPRYPAGDGLVKTSAAWLIERAGFTRGFALAGSGAAISSKHTLAITNRGTATAADVEELARAIHAGVRDTFGVALVPEPVLVGLSLG